MKSPSMRTPGGSVGSRGKVPGGWVALFALALAIRVAYLYEIEGLVYFYHLVGDAKGYDEWAVRLAGGGWWWPETFYQAPLYPYLLAGVYRLFGHDLWTLRIIQCVLGSAGCVLVGLAGERFLSGRVGVIAGVLMAVYPPAIYFDCIVQKAALSFVLIAALLYVLARAAKETSWWLWMAAGVITGLLALTRENALVLGPVIMLWSVWGGGQRRRRSRLVAVTMVIVGLGAALLPASVHNWRVGGEFALTTFQLGPNFYMGNHADADGRYRPLVAGRETPEYERADATALAEAATGRRLSPGEVSSFWMKRAWSYIRSDPIGWTRLLWVKWSLTWNHYEIPDTESYYVYRDRSMLLSVLGQVWHFGVLCPLAVAGVVLTWRRRSELAILYVLALVIGVSVAIFYVFGRYRYPLVPILAILAAAGLAEVTALTRARRWPPIAGAVAVTIVSAIWVNWPINPESELNAAQWANVGAALAADGRPDAALPHFERAVATFPQAPRLQQFLADALSIGGRYAEAIPHYRMALALEPGRPNADFNLAVALERVGRAAEAAEHYNRAADVDPTDTEAHRAVERLSTPP